MVALVALAGRHVLSSRPPRNFGERRLAGLDEQLAQPEARRARHLALRSTMGFPCGSVSLNDVQSSATAKSCRPASPSVASVSMCRSCASNSTGLLFFAAVDARPDFAAATAISPADPPATATDTATAPKLAPHLQPASVDSCTGAAAAGSA